MRNNFSNLPWARIDLKILRSGKYSADALMFVYFLGSFWKGVKSMDGQKHILVSVSLRELAVAMKCSMGRVKRLSNLALKEKLVKRVTHKHSYSACRYVIFHGFLT